jgi:AspT/YidE/YbjL antiporter-like protein
MPDHKTKIVATIGPASESPAILRQMIRAGMNVARLKFSHGEFDSHRRGIGNIRAASKATGQRVAITADLAGPKMRVGKFGVEKTQLKAGDKFTLTTDDIVGDQKRVSVSFAKLPKVLKRGDQVSLNDGYIQLFLGILVGTVPIAFPGLPQPVRLGLAGGPLIVALVLGRVGRIGRLVCHMPVNANLAFREFGIALFFAAVGLAAGPKFFASVFSANERLWLGAGLCVTILPLWLADLMVRGVMKLNFTALSGPLAGSVTDPPALAFATNLARSDAPPVAYATVYPLTMLLRILCAHRCWR